MLVEGVIMVTQDGALILVHKEKGILVSALRHLSIILMLSLCCYVVVVCFSIHNQGIFCINTMQTFSCSYKVVESRWSFV